MRPTVVVVNDFDGFFEKWSNELAEELEKTNQKTIHTISVTSGPYRSSALTYQLTDTGVLKLDFYSAVRSGFGSVGVTQKKFAQLLTNPGE